MQQHYPTSSYDHWKTTDPALEGPECPECGASLDGDDVQGECSEQCGYYHDNCEDIIYEREANRLLD